MKKRLVVGLTGSFGSGKTTVSKIFKRLGAKKIISADQVAREAFSPNRECFRKIKSLFGNKKLSRREIAKAVFSDPKKRRALERIIHPYVYRRISAEIRKMKQGIMIVEVPLLFEAKFDRLCDVTVTVSAGTSNRKRLLRLGFSPNEIKARIKAQLPEPEKIKRADFIINNIGTRKSLYKRTKFVWQQLKSELN